MANLSIKSRLLVMLLGVSAVSIAIVASLSYYASYNALRDSVFNQLTSLRAIKAERIETYFKDLQLEAGGIVYSFAKGVDFATNLIHLCTDALQRITAEKA